MPALTYKVGTVNTRAGDVNGDGLNDLIVRNFWAVTSQYGNAYSSGKSYISLGQSASVPNNLNLNPVALQSSTKVEAPELSIVGNFDINQDGINDLMINTGINKQVKVIFGKPGLDLASKSALDNLNGQNGFVIESSNLKSLGLNVAMSAAGDINQDGIQDIIIGDPTAAPNNQENAGASYVIFGKKSGFSPSLNVADINAKEGLVIQGQNPQEKVGSSVSNLGDINGDGIDDFILGAPGASPNGKEGAGAAYIIFGKVGGFTKPINVSDLNGSNGFVIK